MPQPASNKYICGLDDSFEIVIAITQISERVFNGNGRSLRAVRNIVYSFFIKGYSIVLQFALVPLTLNYLDKFNYGLWLTLASFFEWFTFFDVGVGHGLRNKLAEALAANDMQLARTYVSTAYAFVTVIFLGFILLFSALNPFLNWGTILNAPAAGDELGQVALCVVIFFCLRCIFSLISVVLYAHQSPALNNLMGPLGSTLAYAGIYILTKTLPGSLFWAALVLSGAPLLILVLFSFILFGGSYKHIAPHIKSVKLEHTRKLLGLGLQFFIIQMSVLVVYSTDKVILTQLFGPEEVTVYNIALKYFTIGMMINGIITYTFWTPFTEAFTKGDFPWIRKTLKRLNLISLVTGLAVVFSAFLADPFIHLWVGDVVRIPDSIKMAFTVFVLINLSSAPYNMFINGAGKIRLQLYTAMLSVILTVPLSMLFSLRLGFGPAGVVMAMACSVLPNAVLFRVQSNRIINGTAKGIWNR